MKVQYCKAFVRRDVGYLRSPNNITTKSHDKRLKPKEVIVLERFITPHYSRVKRPISCIIDENSVRLE